MTHKRYSYALVPLSILLTSLVGGIFVTEGIEWYQTLSLPSWNPTPVIHTLVGMFFYICVGASAILAFAEPRPEKTQQTLSALFAGNACANIAWNWLFFVQQDLLMSAVGAAAITLLAVVTALSVFPLNKRAAWLLVPYIVWDVFMTVLTVAIVLLNPA
jgi:tryptophan-rich sensory protein